MKPPPAQMSKVIFIHIWKWPESNLKTFDSVYYFLIPPPAVTHILIVKVEGANRNGVT